MVFDGRQLSPYETQLLADLREAQSTTPGGPLPDNRPGPGRPRERRIGAIVMATFVVLFVAVAGIAVAARQPAQHDDRLEQDDAQAMTAVGSAIEQTVAANEFDFDYRMAETPPANPTTTAPQRAHVIPYNASSQVTNITPPPEGQASAPESQTVEPKICEATATNDVTVTGQGTINVTPKAMTASADISSGLSVGLSLRGDYIQESGGVDYGSVVGAPELLSGFASLVQSTLGPRAGALAMTEMASPAGYLALEKEAVTGATSVGTGTVEGAAVTNYDVTVDLARLPAVPGLTADERQTIEAALGVLQSEVFTKTTVRVAIDEAGFIRQIQSVAHFADGGQVTYDATYRNFGCAATLTETASTPRSDTDPCATAPTSTVTTETTVASTSIPDTTVTAPPTTAATEPTAPTTTTTEPTTTSTAN